MNNEHKILMDEAVRIIKDIAAAKNRLAEIDAVLESEGLRVLSDKKIKQIILYGRNSNQAAITLAAKVEVLNREALSKVLPSTVLQDMLTEKESVTYTFKDSFKRFLAAVRLGDYIKDTTIEEFLQSAFPSLNSKEREFLLKKLKGSYANDRKWLVTVVGEGDWDVELYHISQILNWNIICSFFGKVPSDEELEKVSSAVLVDETLKIEYGYAGK